jgi:hypothetical protein
MPAQYPLVLQGSEHKQVERRGGGPTQKVKFEVYYRGEIDAGVQLELSQGESS